MLIASKYEVPDSCPEDCLGKNDGVGQGGFCHRCPVFNCSGSPMDKEEQEMLYPPDHVYDPNLRFSILEPEEYRPDWAAEWVKFFKDGTFPKLYLERSK